MHDDTLNDGAASVVPLAGTGGQPDVLGGAEDTIITWTDAELETDIALSFQEELGCNYVWCASATPLGPHRALTAATETTMEATQLAPVPDTDTPIPLLRSVCPGTDFSRHNLNICARGL